MIFFSSIYFNKNRSEYIHLNDDGNIFQPYFDIGKVDTLLLFNTLYVYRNTFNLTQTPK